MLKAILISFLICSQALACPQNVQKVKEGSVVNCNGWLVSEPTMQDMARNADTVETQKKLILTLEHLRVLDAKEIEHYKKHSKEAHAAYERSERQKFWVAAGAYTLGVVLTGIAAKAAIESTRR